MRQRLRAVACERELEYPLEVAERSLGEDDHATFRALGRAPVFFMPFSRRDASAWNAARDSSACTFSVIASSMSA